MTVEEASIISIGIAAWHLAALNAISMYTRAFARSWFVPLEVLLSAFHLLGALAALFAIAIFIGSARVGFLNYGVFLAGGLLLFDTLMIYKALKNYK
jgi:hypothetical protein